MTEENMRAGTESGDREGKPRGETESGETRSSATEQPETSRNLEWRCLTCGVAVPPTTADYMSFIQHPCQDRKIWLVDKESGEQLANNLKQAQTKGFIPRKGEEKPEGEGEEKPKGEVPKFTGTVAYAKKPTELPEVKPKLEEKPKGEQKEITEPQVSFEGIFRYTVTLPADAFTLFNLAKSLRLEKDGEKPFDEWLWDCIVARFKFDYKRQLILAPIEREKEVGDGQRT